MRHSQTYLWTLAVPRGSSEGVHTNPKLAAFGVVALLALLSVAMVPAARADTGLPAWVKGDFWQYAITGASGTGITGTGTIKYVVLGTDVVSAGASSYTAYHTRMWINITSGSTNFIVPGEAWFRTSDLSLVKMNFTFTLVIFGQTIVDQTTIWNIPPPTYTFPLTANATWSASTMVETQALVTGQAPSYTFANTTTTFLVESTVSKTVQAGTFSTSPVRATDSSGAYTRSYWSFSAGNYVEQDSYSSTGSNQGSQTLQSYQYSPTSGTSGQNLLGLPLFAWILIVVVIVVVVAVAVLMMRRPKQPVMMPPGQPGMAPPPYMPPQQPPSSPPQ